MSSIYVVRSQNLCAVNHVAIVIVTHLIDVVVLAGAGGSTRQRHITLHLAKGVLRHRI